MKTRKIIIEIRDGISEEEALVHVVSVVQSGRISEHKNGKHYCWATVFKDGINVWVRTKRTKTSPDSFIVTKR